MNDGPSTFTTEQAWRDAIAALYSDAKPEEFLTLPDGSVYFRLNGAKDPSYSAAWFPAMSYGFVD